MIELWSPDVRAIMRIVQSMGTTGRSREWSPTKIGSKSYQVGVWKGRIFHDYRDVMGCVMMKQLIHILIWCYVFSWFHHLEQYISIARVKKCSLGMVVWSFRTQLLTREWHYSGHTSDHETCLFHIFADLGSLWIVGTWRVVYRGCCSLEIDPSLNSLSCQGFKNACLRIAICNCQMFPWPVTAFNTLSSNNVREICVDHVGEISDIYINASSLHSS